jgi:hypothetical protein
LAKFRYLGKTVAHRNLIHEENKRNARYGGVTAVLLRIQVFWDVMPYRILHKYVANISEDPSSFIFRAQQPLLGLLNAENKGNTVLRNVGNYLVVDMASHLRRIESSV